MAVGPAALALLCVSSIHGFVQSPLVNSFEATSVDENQTVMDFLGRPFVPRTSWFQGHTVRHGMTFRWSRGYDTENTMDQVAYVDAAILAKEQACLKVNITAMDWKKPLKVALQDHPDASDGFCLFASAGSWLRMTYRSLQMRNYTMFSWYMRDRKEDTYLQKVAEHPDEHLTGVVRYSDYEEVAYRPRPSENGLGAGEGDSNASANGRWQYEMWTNNDEYIYDDFYCHANKWMDLPSHLVENPVMWEHLASHECERLTRLFPEHLNFTMSGPSTDIPWSLQEDFLWNNFFNGWWGPPSRRAAQQHAALKCALGSIAVDMSFCALNFCTFANNTIGHLRQCPDEILPKVPGYALDEAIKQRKYHYDSLEANWPSKGRW